MGGEEKGRTRTTKRKNAPIRGREPERGTGTGLERTNCPKSGAARTVWEKQEGAAVRVNSPSRSHLQSNEVGAGKTVE